MASSGTQRPLPTSDRIPYYPEDFKLPPSHRSQDTPGALTSKVASKPGIGREDMVRPSRDRDTKGRCSNDHVQSWLEKTQRRPAWEAPNETPQDDEVFWRPHDLGVVDTEMPTYMPRLRKRRHGSLDSSIIPDQPRRGEHRALRAVISKRPSSARKNRDRDDIERPQSSATMSPIPQRHDTGPFEKRARHKTNPDRYKTRKRKNAEGGDGRLKARRTRAPGKKKLLSSREVMHNFASDAILAEGRLTVEPAFAPGLYGNARCGSRMELPDLSYNSMDFLAEEKRRDHDFEQSSIGLRGTARRKEGVMRASSPLFVPRSESSEPRGGECSRDTKAMSPPAWERHDKAIPVASRPRTAPLKGGTIYEPPRHRGYHGPARAGSSLDSRDFSTRDQGLPYGAESPRKATEDYIGSTPELMRRLLCETGVFDGLKRLSHSATEAHRHLERPGEGGSPPHQETATLNREGVRCAEKSTMATLPEPGDYSVIRPPLAPQAIAKPEWSRKTDTATSENRLQARVEPSHRLVSDLAAVDAAVIAPTGDTRVDRTKIALMAQIPVYCHQESQTESPWQVPQESTYIHAGTQTVASSTQDCGRCQIPDDARFSPVQRHSSTEELLMSGERQANGDSLIWAPDDADPKMFRTHPHHGRDDTLSRLASGSHQTHRALQQQMSLESQDQLYAGSNGFEGPIPFPNPRDPCHPKGRDDESFSTPMEKDTTFDEGSSHYPRAHDVPHPESQGAGVRTFNNNPAPDYRHVGGEATAYHPNPLHYRLDKVTAVQPLDTSEVVHYPHRPAFRMLAQEPCSYPQETLYPPESLLRPSHPGIHDPGQNDVPSWGHNKVDHRQDENQVNAGEKPHAFAHKQQRARDDLGQEQLEAYWRNRQLDFARRYGY